jgi:hypothetical protein
MLGHVRPRLPVLAEAGDLQLQVELPAQVHRDARKQAPEGGGPGTEQGTHFTTAILSSAVSNHSNKHAYASQLNRFTHLRALMVLHDHGTFCVCNGSVSTINLNGQYTFGGNSLWY